MEYIEDKMNFSKETETTILIDYVKLALIDLLSNNKDSIAKGEHEATLAGMYLTCFSSLIKNKDEVNLHLEYNRYLRYPEAILRGDNRRFDLVLHTPGSNDHNLIHWEFTQSVSVIRSLKLANTQFTHERRRLIATTSSNDELRRGSKSGAILGQFSLGVLCCFYTNRPNQLYLNFYENEDVLVDESGFFDLVGDDVFYLVKAEV